LATKKKATKKKAKKKETQVFVFEVEVIEPDPDDSDDISYFDIPETLEGLNTIASSLRQTGEDCGIESQEWYFLHEGEAIPIADLPGLTARGEKIIEAIKNSKDDGDMIWIQFACIEEGAADHWDTDFREMSEGDGCRGLLVVYGNHSEFGPNVFQKYSDGEFDTGIESEREPDVYCVTPDWDKHIGKRHLLEFLDTSFYA